MVQQFILSSFLCLILQIGSQNIWHLLFQLAFVSPYLAKNCVSETDVILLRKKKMPTNKPYFLRVNRLSRYFGLIWAFRFIGEHRQASVGCPSVFHTLSTCSTQKPLGLGKPNCIWSLRGLGEWKLVQMVLVMWPKKILKWCPYMVKTF